MTIAVKRVYEKAQPGDGLRVLVDRLWPRGLSKREVAIDIWAKELAPSVPLRKWFHTDPKRRWKEFVERYKKELRFKKEEVATFRKEVGRRKVTLLFAGADTVHTHARVLQKFLAKGRRF